MKKKTWIWIIAAVVVVIIIAVAAGGNNSLPTTNEEAKDSSKEWVELMTFSGSGDKKSNEFYYSGGKARLRYDFQGDEYGLCAIYVVKEGTDIMLDGGFPEVMLENSEKGESNLSHLKKGSYYLNVTSANGKWSVTVEELK